MPQKKYIVRLTAEEREVCRETIRKLNGSSERVRRAQILLKADADGPGWTDEQIADAFSCRTNTVENVRQRCVLEGFERALERKQRASPASPPVPKLCWTGNRSLSIVRGFLTMARRLAHEAPASLSALRPCVASSTTPDLSRLRCRALDLPDLRSGGRRGSRAALRHRRGAAPSGQGLRRRLGVGAPSA